MYIHRLNEVEIHRSFETERVTALLGARQVGKTTLVTEYMKQHSGRSWVTLNMDRFAERDEIKTKSLKALIEESATRLIGNGSKIWVLIDEAQKCPELFDQIKELYDQYKGKDVLKFILTGSGHLSLHKLSAESLAGRIELFNLREFGLREQALLQHKLSFPKETIFEYIFHDCAKEKLLNYIKQISPFNKILCQELQKQLIWGGLPDVLKKNEVTEKLRYLSDYLQTYLEKDIRGIETISDLYLYRNLMSIIAEQTGSIRDDDKTKQSLGCARDTLKKYRGYLLATLMYLEIYPFIGSTLKKLVKAPKGYLFDNGLISYLTGIDQINLLEKSGLVGHRLENWFLKELRVALDREVKNNEIYYWRTRGGVEVDFVAEIKPNIYPFEITYSKQINTKKQKNLVQFLHDEPKAKYGIYVYLGEFHFDSEAKIYYLPAWVIV